MSEHLGNMNREVCMEQQQQPLMSVAAFVGWQGAGRQV